MTLRKVDRFWWLDIRIEGKRIRRSLKTESKFEAMDRYKQVKDKLLQERRGKDVRFADFAKKYLDWAWTAKPASADREEQRLKKIEKFFNQLGIVFLSDITPYHIEQLRAWLKEIKDEPVKEGETKKPDRSKATINRYLQLLRGLFYRAIDWEAYQGSNPLKKVRFFKESPQIRSLPYPDLKRILEASREISKKPKSPVQKIFHDLVVFALNTGMRKSEILNLEWKDVKEDEAMVKGKGDRRRTVPLNGAALELLGRQPKRSSYVFDIPNRGQKDLFRRTVNQIKKRTGIDFHFHLLRHFFTTSLLEKGVDFVTIGSILGHSKITTSLIYSHTDREKQRKAVRLLEG
jgi:integrase